MLLVRTRAVAQGLIRLVQRRLRVLLLLLRLVHIPGGLRIGGALLSLACLLKRFFRCFGAARQRRIAILLGTIAQLLGRRAKLLSLASQLMLPLRSLILGRRGLSAGGLLLQLLLLRRIIFDSLGQIGELLARCRRPAHFAAKDPCSSPRPAS